MKKFTSVAASLALGAMTIASGPAHAEPANEPSATPPGEKGDALARAVNASRGKIINGVPAAPGQLPFQVSLFTTALGHFCGGSLINEDWVVTAAHCIVLEEGDSYRVLTGTNDLLRGGEIREVEKVIAHPQYGSSGHAHDVALMKLAPAAASRSGAGPVRAVRLGQGEPRSGGAALVSGFGTTESDKVSFQLLVADVPIVSNEACNAPEAYGGQIVPGMLCAGGNNKDSCQGDSGGPLVMGTPNNYQLVGIVSWGAGCNEVNKYGVYTRVSAYQDWIMSTMAQN